MANNQIKAIPLSSVNSASVGASYVPIDTEGLDAPCFLLKIINSSDQAITISYNGIDDNDYVAANATLQVQGNSSQPYGAVSTFPKGQLVYIKGTAGTGFIRLIGYYNP